MQEAKLHYNILLPGYVLNTNILSRLPTLGL